MPKDSRRLAAVREVYIDARLTRVLGIGVVIECFLVSLVSLIMVDHLDHSIINSRLPGGRGTPWGAISFVSVDVLHHEVMVP